MRSKKIYVLMGGSGSGKTTLGEHLKSIGIPEIVSHTTRRMRDGEIDGVTYYFINKEEFSVLEKIEWTEYSGNFYCLSKKEVDSKLEKYDRIFAITDLFGAEQLKAQYPNEVEVIYIYISQEEMEKRMRERGDSEENIQKRLRYANESGELDNYIHANYLIENLDLNESKQRLEKIVFVKEKKEIERRFLIKNSIDLDSLPKKELIQGYVSYEPEQRILKEDNQYFLINKSDGDLIREEKTKKLSKEEFEYYSCFVLGDYIEKTRYFKSTGNLVAEIDVYHKNLDGLMVVKVEFMSEEEANSFVVPGWFGEEITYKKEYKNRNLARFGKPKLVA